MKDQRSKSLLNEVIEADYTMGRDQVRHSPSSTIPNIKRLDKIVAKMRKAGITDDEIDFIQDFAAADALHVIKLMDAADAQEGESKRKKAAKN